MPRCHYEVLEVSRSASQGEIKKAYRELALKWHPDKNKHNQEAATARFKEINQAYSVLSNPEKRQHYDEYGHDEPRPAYQQPQYQYRQYGGGYQQFDDADFNPFFQFMFNGMRPEHMRYYARRQRRPTAQTEADEQANVRLLSILPFLFIFALLLLSQASSQPKTWSFERSGDYPIARRTAAHHVSYYVSEAFEAQYLGDPANVRQIDQTIEREWLSELKARCTYEQHKRSEAIRAALHPLFGSSEKSAAAQSIPTPSCSRYTETRNAFSSSSRF